LGRTLIVFLNHFLHSQPAQKEPGLGMEFILSKSRFMMITLFLGAIAAILVASGIVMALVGLSIWISDATNTMAHALMFSGIILAVLGSVGAAFGLSKKRFKLDNEEATRKLVTLPEPKPTTSQVVEELVIGIIKEFAKESNQFSKTAAPKAPTNTQTA
jgi:hypothetical protein